MCIDFFRFDRGHLIVDSAMHPDCTALDASGWVAPPCEHKPTPLSCLAWHTNHGTLGRIQLPFPVQSGCAVIPNPWDVGSARCLQRLGFKAPAQKTAGGFTP